MDARRILRRTGAGMLLTAVLLGAGASGAVAAPAGSPSGANGPGSEAPAKKGSFDITKKGSFDLN